MISYHDLNAAIYGKDDREFVVERPSERREMLPVLTMLSKYRYSESSKGITLRPVPLKDHLIKLCPGERFEEEPSYSKCTAFIVEGDYLVTAGHCVVSQEDCESKRWLLSQSVKGEVGEFFYKEEVIYCEKLVSREKNRMSENDFALIKIKSERDLPEPFQFYKDDPFKNRPVFNDKTYYVLGHPSGLPLIDSGDSEVIPGASQFIFKIDSDTFSGNSGSPVIDKETGVVFGILTDGEKDYHRDSSETCNRTYHCHNKGEEGCAGENVVPLWNIKELVPGDKPQGPIFDPRHPRL